MSQLVEDGDLVPSEEKTFSLFDIALQHWQRGVAHGAEQLLNDGANLMWMCFDPGSDNVYAQICGVLKVHRSDKIN